MKFAALLLVIAFITINCVAQSNKPVFNEDQSQMLMNGKVILDSQKDGFLGLSKIRFSPDGKRFFVLACGFECTDNVAFIFNANGTGKRRFTTAWDWVFQEGIEWSADSKLILYYRINSTAAEPPKNAPKEGWVQVNVNTGAKTFATTRALKSTVTYGVFRVRFDDTLNIRSAPGTNTEVVGKIPSDGKGLQFVGESKQIAKETWVKIKFGAMTGWVNQSFLYEDAK